MFTNINQCTPGRKSAKYLSIKYNIKTNIDIKIKFKSVANALEPALSKFVKGCD